LNLTVLCGLVFITTNAPVDGLYPHFFAFPFPFVRVSRIQQLDLTGKDMLYAEAKICVVQPGEAPDQQPGADEQGH
jgi:hypothetical protein